MQSPRGPPTSSPTPLTSAETGYLVRTVFLERYYYTRTRRIPHKYSSEAHMPQEYETLGTRVTQAAPNEHSLKTKNPLVAGFKVLLNQSNRLPWTPNPESTILTVGSLPVKLIVTRRNPPTEGPSPGDNPRSHTHTTRSPTPTTHTTFIENTRAKI